MVSDIGFIRRKNPDSTTDLICLRCFMTVGNAKDETDFSALELLHCCDPLHVRFPLDFQDRLSLPEKVEWPLRAREETSKKG
jgi:hypothetical protein